MVVEKGVATNLNFTREVMCQLLGHRCRRHKLAAAQPAAFLHSNLFNRRISRFFNISWKYKIIFQKDLFVWLSGCVLQNHTNILMPTRGRACLDLFYERVQKYYCCPRDCFDRVYKFFINWYISTVPPTEQFNSIKFSLLLINQSAKLIIKLLIIKVL